MGSRIAARARGAAALAILTGAIAGACGMLAGGAADTRGPDTPEKAFHRVRGALLEEDWAALYEAAASPSTRRVFDADLERVRKELAASGGDRLFAESVLGVTVEEYHRMDAGALFVATSRAAGKPAKLLVMVPDREVLRDAEIVETRTEGDEATLLLKVAGGSRPFGMVREEGRWYVRLVNAE